MAVPHSPTVPLLCVSRAGVQDNFHRGAAVAVDDEGKVLLAVGDPSCRGYIRSAAKPIQAIPVLACGAAAAFGLDEADIAIVCGSHRGGDEQVRQVRAVLAKAGVAEAHLAAGSGIRDNCSGKHSGMLSACKHLGEELAGYTCLSHPHQQRILKTLANVCGLPVDDIHVGVDGCGAPIHYFPIRHMALGYARLSRPEMHFTPAIATAVRRIIPAMAAHPVGHTGEPAYAEALGEARFLTKAGGSGVYCAGVVDRGIGFAMKVEDGSPVPLKVVFTEVMRRLGVLSEQEAALFRERFCPTVVNRRGAMVGKTKLLF
jgi:L-asparaginase II